MKSRLLDSDGNQRTRPRGGVAVDVHVRTPGNINTRGTVTDLSETGFRLQCLTDLPGDRHLYVTIPTFAQMEARIAWRKEWTYGCEFVRPLYSAVYDHIVKVHPALFRPLQG